MDYKIYVPSTMWQDAVKIPKGVYDVLSDNSSYDKEPSCATIQVAERKVLVPFITFSMIFYRFNNTVMYAVISDFEEKDFKQNLSEEEMWEDLEALRPHHMTVEEFVSGGVDWDGFNSLKEAWQHAKLDDLSAYFVTKKRMNKIFAEVISKHY